MRYLALIPARSGSKGLKDKNIRPLCGIPLMQYSIDAAKKSGIFCEIHVSTDSEQYAKIACAGGASVPFLRTKRTSTDRAATGQVIEEVVEHYLRQGEQFDAVMVLQPTSPLRTAEDICGAVKLFERVHADSVVSVCQVNHSPLWCNTLPQNGSMSNFLKPEALHVPRQGLETYYRINGACYLSKLSSFQEIGSWYGPNSFAYIMPKERSVDIDDEVDFRLAEALLRSAVG